MAEEAAADGGSGPPQYYYNGEYYATGCEDLNEETLELLRCDHPRLTALKVDFHERFANIIDWTEEACMADNSHLRKLVISTHTDGPPFDKWQKKQGKKLRSFCDGVARNKSIYHLEVVLCGRGLPMHALAPFIRDNGNLRTLKIAGRYDRLSRWTQRTKCKLHNVASLVAALRNRETKQSLQRIELSSTGIRHHTQSVNLMGALEQYPHLQSLSLGGEELDRKMCEGLRGLLQNPECKLMDLNLSDCWWMALGDVWGRPNCMLEELHIDDCVTDDQCAVAIAGGLAKNRSIKVLSISVFEDCEGSESVWQAFFDHLKDAIFLLEKLYFSGPHCIDDAGAISMVNMLSRMRSTLKVLDMHGTDSIDSAGWMALCNLLRSDSIRLTELDLHDVYIHGKYASALASALAERTSLEVLDLGYSIDGSSPEWSAFFRSLEHHTSLARLELSGAGMDDESATILAEALASSATLKDLGLGADNDFSAARFVTVLRNPNSALEDLCLEGARIDDTGAVAFARALADNTTLTSLSLGIREGNEHDSTTQDAIEAFAQLLCSKSSVMDTLNSNHTLQDMGRGIPNELVNLLSWNKLSNKHEVARRKILNTHFTGNEIDIQVFVGMKLNILPQAMAWAGRDGTGHSLLYELVRGIPSLVECGNARKDAVSGKRKRAVISHT